MIELIQIFDGYFLRQAASVTRIRPKAGSRIGLFVFLRPLIIPGATPEVLRAEEHILTHHHDITRASAAIRRQGTTQVRFSGGTHTSPAPVVVRSRIHPVTDAVTPFPLPP
jgi:hypothetical protein